MTAAALVLRQETPPAFAVDVFTVGRHALRGHAEHQRMGQRDTGAATQALLQRLPRRPGKAPAAQAWPTQARQVHRWRMQQRQRRIVWWLAALAAMGAAAAAFVQGGYYNVAATVSHTQPVYWLLEYAMQQSVRRRARHIDAPPLDRPGVQARGAACYREHCISCHGAPGLSPSPWGLSMQPLPGSLVAAAAHWRPHEIYWITRHGLKLTGMPAWQHRMADEDLWAVTAFVSELPRQTPQQVKQRLSTLARCPPPDALQQAGTPNPRRGRQVFTQYGCQGCHVIEGVVGSNVHVGPPLRNLARRDTLPGGQPNTREHLAQWLRDPLAIDAHTAMPSLGVTQQDAIDMAAYLHGQR